MHQERYISEKVAAMWNYPTRSSAVAGNPTRPIWTSCLSPFKAVDQSRAKAVEKERKKLNKRLAELDRLFSSCLLYTSKMQKQDITILLSWLLCTETTNY